MRCRRSSARGPPCPDYLVVEHTITAPAKFARIPPQNRPLIEKRGGRYITKAGSHKLLETARRPPDRIVIIEFPDMAELNEWYSSPEYQPLIALRQSAVDMDRETLITLESM